MKNLSPVPYRAKFCPAEQLSEIICQNRNTLLGIVDRYDLESVGLVPGRKGATRLFTMEQVGILAVLKVAARARQASAVAESLDRVSARAAALYDELGAGIRWEQHGDGAGVPRPYLPEPGDPVELEGDASFGAEGVGFAGTFRVVPAARDKGYYIDHLDGYPIPMIRIPIDRTLRLAWTRATWTFYDFELPGN